MQRVSLTLKIWRQLAIGDACSYGHGACLAIQDHLVEMGQGNLILRAIGNPVEGVASPERPELAAALYHLLHFLDGLWLVQPVGAVSVVS